MARLCLAAVLAWLACAPAPAAAQSANETALARRFFRAGIQAARSRSWDEAREAFQRSYDLSPRPVTLLNLAAAQAESGRLVEASESYRRFLHDVTQGRHSRAAEQALAGLEPRIPHLDITIAGLTDDHVIRLDGDELSHAALGSALPVDPGRHELMVVAPDGDATHETVSVGEGDRASVRLRAPMVRLPVAPPPNDDDDEGGISPWVWVGAGAAAVTAAVVLIVVTTGGSGGSPPRGDPFTGTLGPGYWEIR